MQRESKTPPLLRTLTRRGFLLRIAAGASAFGTAGAAYARYVEPFLPEFVRVPMPLKGLHPDLAGLRIIQISDIHVGDLTPDGFLRTQFEHISSLSPDLIVITGDLLTYADPRQIDQLEKLIPSLRARYGVAVSLGNHDYNFGVSRPHKFRPSAEWPVGAVADALCEMLRSRGIRVLRNEIWKLSVGRGAIQLVGLEDLLSDFYDPARAFRGIDTNTPSIALSHNPDTIADLCGFPCEWVLAGHTHGGQVRLPLIGALILPNELSQFDMGLFNVAGVKMYINRGLGYLLQARFNCRPEITEFTLQSA